jgi:peptidoglycan hydrolase CwlO-like protein
MREERFCMMQKTHIAKWIMIAFLIAAAFNIGSAIVIYSDIQEEKIEALEEQQAQMQQDILFLHTGVDTLYRTTKDTKKKERKSDDTVS